jgi:transposase InsO family protein
MRDRISDHIQKCLMCLTYNPPDGKKDGYLYIPEKPIIPFDTIHIDHVGPFEITKMKNVHILVVVDSFTKITKLYPTKSTKTSEVIKHMKSYFHIYSVPRKLVSDRGTAFTSREFSKFMDELNIQHVLIATSYPQANGQVERYNRTIVPLLAKLVEESQVEWDKVLNEAEYLLNNSYNRSIKNIPSRLLFGVIQM